MSQPKFKAGDKVKTAGGLDGEIVQVNTAGTAALVNAGKDKTFESSWYSVDSLKKPSSKTAKTTTASPGTSTDQGAGDYLFKLTDKDGEAYEIAVEGAESEAAAVDALLKDSDYSEGSNIITGEKVD